VLKIVYLLVRQVLGLAILMFRGDGVKEAELGAPARDRHRARQRHGSSEADHSSVIRSPDTGS